jgi:hypothetical protein
VQAQQQQTATQLQGQVTQAQQRLDSLNAQIKDLQASGGQASDITRLKAQRTNAENALASVQQYATTTLASSETLTQSIIRGSQVLNQAVPVKSSFKKGVLIYGIGGLVAGLMIGLAIVVIGAITSDRLRRRDDIAYAINAPVRLSVGPMRKSRWVPEFPARSASRRRDMDRVVEHLKNIVPGNSRGPAGLAVVAVDDARTAAQAVVEFVLANAKRHRIVIADLAAGTPAARLLGVDRPGVATISPSGSPVVVVVPAPEDIAPAGHIASRSSRMHPDEKVTSAASHADLVLSLVTLDPAFGGDHIATWATDAAAIVTAGGATATRVHAAGEMIRLAGVRLTSVVVLNADPSDESLGALSEDYQPATA